MRLHTGGSVSLSFSRMLDRVRLPASYRYASTLQTFACNCNVFLQLLRQLSSSLCRRELSTEMRVGYSGVDTSGQLRFVLISWLAAGSLTTCCVFIKLGDELLQLVAGQ